MKYGNVFWKQGSSTSCLWVVGALLSSTDSPDWAAHLVHEDTCHWLPTHAGLLHAWCNHTRFPEKATKVTFWLSEFLFIQPLILYICTLLSWFLSHGQLLRAIRITQTWTGIAVFIIKVAHWKDTRCRKTFFEGFFLFLQTGSCHFIILWTLATKRSKSPPHSFAANHRWLTMSQTHGFSARFGFFSSLLVQKIYIKQLHISMQETCFRQTVNF